MPMKSEAQRRWMHANKPEMADRWEKETPKGKLPEHAAKKKKKHSKNDKESPREEMMANEEKDMPAGKHTMPNGKMMMGKKEMKKKGMPHVRYEPKE